MNLPKIEAVVEAWADIDENVLNLPQNHREATINWLRTTLTTHQEQVINRLLDAIEMKAPSEEEEVFSTWTYGDTKHNANAVIYGHNFCRAAFLQVIKELRP